tara:strand:- start:218 stop:439 length:222 start_codon:yes stop_codon:yes gene_type:complete
MDLLIYPANIVILLDGMIGLWVVIKDSRRAVVGDFSRILIKLRVEQMPHGDLQLAPRVRQQQTYTPLLGVLQV